ncbi:hypothetical protein HETIRDRAFT_169056 [Heterobasidion irregulare TC 32-1]|uniref:Uncharacterized protein n=1 Tax=Heterobasidion irregulare (strain TC 32-1) TaxID=747525 RepID=W4K856_HETIT|nr:uncharacterized protein HETIRDRAFT_169056 [Heterobasidion irregulare TC 32-1]ETW81973.1 hypothetical protein HETIRDRAFT_169056 [Heterobasidion irregulare TC 32-1]
MSRLRALCLQELSQPSVHQAWPKAFDTPPINAPGLVPKKICGHAWPAKMLNGRTHMTPPIMKTPAHTPNMLRSFKNKQI